MHPLYKQALSDGLIIINTNRVYFLKNGSQTLITYPISTINRFPCFNHVISCFSIALQCPYCRNEYDMQAIEQMLITNAQEKSMAFVLQDVACSKCQGVSVNYNNILCIVYLLFIFFQQSKDYRYQISCMPRLFGGKNYNPFFYYSETPFSNSHCREINKSHLLRPLIPLFST